MNKPEPRLRGIHDQGHSDERSLEWGIQTWVGGKTGKNENEEENM